MARSCGVGERSGDRLEHAINPDAIAAANTSPIFHIKVCFHMKVCLKLSF